MTINQVYPPDWELTRAGDKAARSVANAKRGLQELASRYDMKWYDLEGWDTLAIQIAFAHHFHYTPTDKAIRDAWQELEREWRESNSHLESA